MAKRKMKTKITMLMIPMENHLMLELIEQYNYTNFTMSRNISIGGRILACTDYYLSLPRKRIKLGERSCATFCPTKFPYASMQKLKMSITNMLKGSFEGKVIHKKLGGYKYSWEVL